MTSIPRISHRMFVSALAPESKGDEKGLKRQSVVNRSSAVLEVLDATEPLIDLAARPLRGSVTPATAC